VPTDDGPGQPNAPLPSPLAPFARYLPFRWSGNHIYVSGQVAALEGEFIHRGRLGAELSLEDGQACARQCALNVLALLEQELGDLASVKEITKVTAFVASTHDFVEQHIVANGASSAFIEYLGDRGEHSRSVIGVPSLPMNSPVEVEAIVLVDRE